MKRARSIGSGKKQSGGKKQRVVVKSGGGGGGGGGGGVAVEPECAYVGVLVPANVDEPLRMTTLEQLGYAPQPRDLAANVALRNASRSSTCWRCTYTTRVSLRRTGVRPYYPSTHALVVDDYARADAGLRHNARATAICAMRGLDNGYEVRGDAFVYSLDGTPVDADRDLEPLW